MSQNKGVIQPRLERLEQMLGDPLFESILWGHEYDLNGLDNSLRVKIESGQFKRIVFYGMGCSSVVSDIVKGFFLTEHIPIHVQVVNDYDSDWFIDRDTLKDDSTLTIIVCYSGWSVEPCLFFDTMRNMTGNRNLIVLSGGGKIASLCQEHGTSLIQYKLRHADREYPLYHVQQFFSIFLDLFYKLKITKSSYQSELEDSVKFLKAEFHEETLKRAEAIAEKLRGESYRPAEHGGLAIVTFCDSNADDYTKNKIQTLKGLFGSKDVTQNSNIEFVNIEINQDDFFKKFFFTHFFTIYIAYYLGKYSDVEGRDLISIAAKNPWWSQRSIELFPKCIDIPSVLES
ncbi:hypothetical protein N7509_010117 [Penicillium cosmopolitanum]|uniref:SIS domain-containing protein n=1 Tax=Penicillium cosmopolitanum TaxID=1131564 RepID=A0A9X0B4C0_9EURO|nr:uncharacterized protein N7509_010117 [Penicillium cosmopolitanum]KAJ5387576.1 hypothetical protein N7509_010117 [Penicillium cosmopolitanum]